jgi:hypothetical protein
LTCPVQWTGSDWGCNQIQMAAHPLDPRDRVQAAEQKRIAPR